MSAVSLNQSASPYREGMKEFGHILMEKVETAAKVIEKYNGLSRVGGGVASFFELIGGKSDRFSEVRQIGTNIETLSDTVGILDDIFYFTRGTYKSDSLAGVIGGSFYLASDGLTLVNYAWDITETFIGKSAAISASVGHLTAAQVTKLVISKVGSACSGVAYCCEIIKGILELGKSVTIQKKMVAFLTVIEYATRLCLIILGLIGIVSPWLLGLLGVCAASFGLHRLSIGCRMAEKRTKSV